MGTDVVKAIMENGFENKKTILVELSKFKPEDQMAKLNPMLDVDVTEEILKILNNNKVIAHCRIIRQRAY